MLGLEEAMVEIERLDRAVHGTTVGTNALIERRGAKTGLITTLGFRDSLEIARSARPPSDYFNLRWNKPEPLVPRTLIFEVDERITFDGSVLTVLDDEDAVAGLKFLVEAGCTAVAICLLFSYANASHEQRIAELARTLHPNLAISVSSARMRSAAPAASAARATPPSSNTTGPRGAKGWGWGASRALAWGRTPSTAS